jgi:ipoprotein LpqH
MRTQIVPAVAGLVVALLAACTPRPPAQLSSTASVTVNGIEKNFHVVKCSQREWTHTIDIGSDFAGAKAIIEEPSEPATAESVHIQNLGGFTGMYSRGDGGDAGVSATGDKFTITGTANGHKADKPSEPATATFKIVVKC